MLCSNAVGSQMETGFVSKVTSGPENGPGPAGGLSRDSNTSINFGDENVIPTVSPPIGFLWKLLSGVWALIPKKT